MNNIDKLTRVMGISLSELARRVDMEPHTLRRYARNETQPKAELALKLATIFGCDPAEVMGFATPEQLPLSKIPLYGSAEAGIGSDITDMDRAIDHVDRPPFGGDCIVQMADDGKLTAIVKEYKNANDEHVLLQQYNPDKEIKITKDKVISIHSIRGMYIT